MGCDDKALKDLEESGKFQFTHPVWGATANGAEVLRLWEVSIHAPRVGCDSDANLTTKQYVGFNSRTPCGVRLLNYASILAMLCFNSRTPCGVRHAGSVTDLSLIHISEPTRPY